MGDPPLDELPVYADDGGDGEGATRPAAEPPRVTARDVAARVGTWVGELVDGDGTLAPSSSFEAGAGDKDDLVVAHRALGDPTALRAAFERRWGDGTVLRSAFGTLRLEPPGEPAARSWPTVRDGRMHLRLSFVPVPVALELTPWHTYGLVLTLSPVRLRATPLGFHRRVGWFRASHRVLDQVRRTVEADVRAGRV